MANQDHIRNPVEWTADQIRAVGSAVGQTGHALRDHEDRHGDLPAIRRITVADLGDVLAKGLDDFAACRSDVIFLCVIYPLAGFVLAWSMFNYDVVPLLFPLASGFALIGPVAAVGLYEMSRRREQGATVSWGDAFGVLATPAFGAILVLGLILLGIFLLWLITAYTIYQVTMGQEGIVSLGAFYRDVFTTGKGGVLIVVGVGIGFLFAAAGPGDQRGLVPDAARPRRGAAHRGRDLGPRGAGEPGADGGLGRDRGRRSDDRLITPVAGPDCRDAGARSRHLAPLSQSGGAPVGDGLSQHWSGLRSLFGTRLPVAGDPADHRRRRADHRR